ncbi:unnamed protein product [Vitrella brassicaformis CCMP3155]|uniref:Uncharacterized protein n=1 Tax=Vitrella brassicaformis (strain CCMP3155) TaxID=1169540 RepID=A0A0G4GDB5_VITBC|nr:unnamed protein product [Vitrella brassicaformis CCMP3155]|eukprot:CEM27152.1 unnamed protein product [Vitrella brassicaformis CCMP3155]
MPRGALPSLTGSRLLSDKRVWDYLTGWAAGQNDTSNTTKTADYVEEPALSIMDLLIEELVPVPAPAAFLKADMMLPDGIVVPHDGKDKYEDEFVVGSREGHGELFEGQGFE